MQEGTSKNPAQRAIKRIAPKLLELIVVSLPIARTFCGKLLDQYLKTKVILILPRTGRDLLTKT